MTHESTKDSLPSEPPGSLHPACSAARERVVEAEGIIAGILYESSNLAIGACQGKAARILSALRAVGWDHENSKPLNDKVSYHADNAGGAHGKDTNDK